MLVQTVFTAGMLLSAAAAVPLQPHKRDIVWVTETEVVVVTVDVTVTAGAPPVEANTGLPVYASTTTVLSTSTVQPPAYTPPSSAPSPPDVAPTTPTPSDVAPTTTSIYVAPATTEAPSTYVAPSPTSAAPAATSPASSGGGGSSPSGQTYTGDITPYTPAMGSCGWVNTDSDSVVALSHEIMTPLNPSNPNNNPLCGKTITLSYGGTTHKATVVDTCPGCDFDSVDLATDLFKAVAPNGDGRVHGVEWWFNDYSL